MEATASRDLLEGWPRKGYDGPQPWDADALGVSPTERNAVGSDPNTVTPVVTHTHPILTSGSAHPCVHEIGRKLGQLGFPNSVSEGENPFGAYDATLATAVRGFRNQYGVQADPSGFNGDQRHADAHLDPWTTEAILRAWDQEQGR